MNTRELNRLRANMKRARTVAMKRGGLGDGSKEDQAYQHAASTWRAAWREEDLGDDPLGDWHGRNK